MITTNEVLNLNVLGAFEDFPVHLEKTFKGVAARVSTGNKEILLLAGNVTELGEIMVFAFCMRWHDIQRLVIGMDNAENKARLRTSQVANVEYVQF